MARLAQDWWAVGLWVLAMVFGCMTAPSAHAAGSGITFSPAFTDLAVQGGQSKVSYQLKLYNRQANDQNFRMSVVDFGSLDEAGGVAFLGQPTSELEHRYGLASWMTPEKTAVFVPAGGMTELTMTIENRSSLAPGGHYGAVLATAVTDTGDPVVDPKVGVKQVVSSLVLVTKDGGAEKDLKLVSQHPNGSWGQLPSVIELRFQNTGNVHVVPRGVTELRDATGRVVKRAALNEDSTYLLPESFRRYKTELMAIDTAWLPGWYSLITTYRIDGQDATKVLTSTVWYAGELIVWLVSLIAAACIGGWSWWFWRRRKRK